VLLDKNPHPTDDQIKQALNGNLCRCGSHLRVIRAVKRAAGVKA
jgi:nicotinate dehydrogenase subunit A